MSETEFDEFWREKTPTQKKSLKVSLTIFSLVVVGLWWALR